MIRCRLKQAVVFVELYATIEPPFDSGLSDKLVGDFLIDDAIRIQPAMPLDKTQAWLEKLIDAMRHEFFAIPSGDVCFTLHHDLLPYLMEFDTDSLCSLNLLLQGRRPLSCECLLMART